MRASREHGSALAAIASGGDTSNSIDYQKYAAGGFLMPAAFTGASVSFLVAEKDDGTYQPLYNASNSLVSITVAANRHYPLPAELAGYPFFKIKSVGAEGAARELKVVLKS